MWMVVLLWEMGFCLVLKVETDLMLASLKGRKQEDAFLMMALLRRDNAVSLFLGGLILKLNTRMRGACREQFGLETQILSMMMLNIVFFLKELPFFLTLAKEAPA